MLNEQIKSKESSVIPEALLWLRRYFVIVIQAYNLNLIYNKGSFKLWKISVKVIS